MSDLIERLLRNYKFHGIVGIRAAHKLEAQQAEIERLREALGEIARQQCGGLGTDDVSDSWQHLKCIARKALEQKG